MQLIFSARFVTVASVVLSLASGAFAAPAVQLEARAGDTENELSNGSACKDVTVIFARGTTESGNVGTYAGPPMFTVLRSRLSSVAIQGVPYPAVVAGFLIGGDRAGSQTMANLASQAATRCPNTKIVLSGYSQGGQLVHNAAALLPANVAARVAAALIFGDPKRGQALRGISADKVRTICHIGDNICSGGSLVLLPHLTYSGDALSAALFIQSKV